MKFRNNFTNVKEKNIPEASVSDILLVLKRFSSLRSGSRILRSYFKSLIINVRIKTRGAS